MIPIYKPWLDEDDKRSICETFDTGWVSSKGDRILEFERKFSQYVGKRYGTTTSNGTTALHLALAALGIGSNDEVIVPDFTFVSPINAVIYQNARPALVDAERDGWCIDPTLIKKSISERTKAIVAVHIYGNPAKMDEITEIARDNGLYLIEDCAEAIGSTYEGKMVGSFGDVSCFSFYGNKVITTGEGGMCLTDDKELDSKMKELRDHGMDPSKRFWHNRVGFNYRMTNLQASLGLSQLSKIDRIITAKKRIAALYGEYLGHNIELHKSTEKGESIYWLYSILLKSHEERKKVADFLTESGIETRPFFYPAHEMPPYASYKFKSGNSSVSTDISRRGLNLPSFPQLTEGDVSFICEKVNASLL